MARKRKVDDEELVKRTASEEVESEEESSSEEKEEEEEEDEEEEEEEEEEAEEESSEDKEEEEEEEEEGEEWSEEEEKEEDDASKKEHIRDLLQPFSKEKLIEILKDAASSNPSIFKQLVDSADADPIHRKIFVHGLSWDTKSEDVSAAFKQFGKIEECRVVTDKVTGKTKGYGFVLFKSRDGAVKALKQPQKMISGRMTACQLAAAGAAASNVSNAGVIVNANTGVIFSSAEVGSRKLHVKNVGPQVSVERLRSFFSTFGEIEQGPLGVDKVTGKLRGFAIFVYKTLDGINKALEEPVKNFDGLRLECSVAREGKNSKGNQNAGITVENVDVGSLIGSNVPGNAAMPQYPYGFNPALLGAGAFFMNQNPGLGMMNPLLGMSGSLGQAEIPTSFVGGMPQGVNKEAASPVGSSVGFSHQNQRGVNAVSPSVIFNYGSQAALQGLGAFQGSRVGQSSSNAEDSFPASTAGLGNLPYGR